MSIFKKLLEAKKEIGKISKDSTNPFFKSKYFDINSLLEHVEPILQKNGLLLLQPIESEWVKTVIYDSESGESVKSEIHLGVFDDPQKLGSAITYYRRYTAQSLLGLQAEDDDANKASGNNSTPQTQSPPNTDQRPWLSESQLNKALDRIKAGEDGVYEKIDKAFKMKKEYRAKLKSNLKAA